MISRLASITPGVRLAFLALLVPSLATIGSASPQKQARVVTGKECEVRTNVDEATAKALAARIDEFCAIFQATYDSLGMEARQKNQIVLRLFDNFDDFCDFRDRDAPKMAMRMYSSETLNAIVTYYDPDDRFLASKLFGLCSNMYLRRYVAAPPEWVRRGFEASFRGYEVEPGAQAKRALPLVECVLLQTALKSGKYIPVADLVKRSKPTFEDRPAQLDRMPNLLPDAEAWGLVYYFVEAGPSNEQAAFREYLRGLNAKGAKAGAAQIKGVDWERFEEPWKQAMLAIDAKCDTAEKHMRVGDGYLEVLNYDLAANEYCDAFKLDQKLPGLRYKTGFAFKRAGDYKGAITWLEKAAEEDPKSPLPHYQLARLYSAIDAHNGAAAEPAKAVEEAQRTVDISGNAQPLYIAFLARCQALNGDKKNAVANMKKAMSLADKDQKDLYEKELEKIQKGK